LVGLQSGALRIYRVNELHDQPAKPKQEERENEEASNHASSSKTKPADLLREEEKFSRRPVQQLAIIKEANILLSLSDGYVSLYDLQTYTLQERLEKTKGAISFAVTSNIVKDSATGIPSIVSKLAVAVKRKIMLWRWQDMEMADDVTEMSMIATVKSLTWLTGTKLVVGMDPGFVTVDLETQEVADIVKPSSLNEVGGAQAGTRFGAVTSGGMGYMGMGGWVPKPLASRLGEGQMLLAKDVNTLFIDTDGKALEKRQIPWATAPEAIGYSYPYLLALPPPSKGALEVRNPDTLSLLQTVTLPNATLLHVPQPNISLAHAGKGFLVASDRCIWRMGALDYDSQIDELAAGGRYDEAISLLNMLEDTLLKDKQGRIRELKILKAQGLFDQRKYRDAMDLFSEAKAPPERVIRLYPSVIAGNLSVVDPPKDDDKASIKSAKSVRTAGSKAEKETETTNETNGEVSAESSKQLPSTPASSLLGRWRGSAKKADSDTSSVRSLTVDANEASNKGKLQPDTSDKPLRMKSN
jgi:Vam6/Vps39-like protein vacuolar protein sorting-associated protein 39